MAVLASAQWWVRVGGNALNGGGFDAAISGAGTNYCDQDAAQLSLTDFATSGAGSTTLTSATGGFTSAMVGNCVRIASGTNFQVGYYFVTAYTDANTVTLDRTPTSGGAGSGGTGRLGGAFASVSGSLSTGGTVTAPTITSPLAAGHTINLRGGGTDTPASADYTQTGFATYPAGSTASGLIRVIGYGGRPRIDHDNILFHSLTMWAFDHLMLVRTAATNGSSGSINGTASIHDVRVDQAGHAIIAFAAVSRVTQCELMNSGSVSADTLPAIKMENSSLSACILGNRISGWRGFGIEGAASASGLIANNIIEGCKATASAAIKIATGGATYKSQVLANSIHGNASDGLSMTSAAAIGSTIVANNIFYDNAGYGINATVGSQALNDRLRTFIDYNAFGSNASGALNNLSAGGNDITLSADPFTNAAGDDFTLNNTSGGGASLKSVAFPTSIP